VRASGILRAVRQGRNVAALKYTPNRAFLSPSTGMSIQGASGVRDDHAPNSRRASGPGQRLTSQHDRCPSRQRVARGDEAICL